VNKQYDVFVAGAGVAGCLFARDMARLGHSVLVAERHGRDELGHDWWDTVESDIFEKVGLEPPSGPELVFSYDWIVVSPAGETGTRVKMPATKINIDRKLFARRLVEEAEAAGADMAYNCVTLGPVFDGRFVTGARVKTPDGNEQTIEAKLSIDASGYKGALRAHIPEGYGFRPHLRRIDLVHAYREIREDTSNGGGRSILVVGRHNGAQWVSRDGKGLVDVFACALDVPGHADPKGIVNELVATEGGMGAVMRGGYAERIPIRRAFDSLVAPGLMLIGDSACMCNPLNGSGVSSSLWAAHLAAKAAHKALERGRVDIPDLWAYNADYKRTKDFKFVKLYFLQQFIYTEPREHFHEFLNGGLMQPDGFWDIDEQLQQPPKLEQLPHLAGALRNPGFAARAAATFGLLQAAGLHFKNYPRQYSETSFKSWRLMNRALLRMIPHGGHDVFTGGN
jgi:flavin-dependent dehydrogenase